MTNSVEENVYPMNPYEMDMDDAMGNYAESASSDSWRDILVHHPPPDALPDGWVLHRSRSQPGYVYYWNQFTGECTWDPPFPVTALAGGMPSPHSARSQAAALSGIVAETLHSLQQQQPQLFPEIMEHNNITLMETLASPNDMSDTSSSVKSILKKNTPADTSLGDQDDGPDPSTTDNLVVESSKHQGQYLETHTTSSITTGTSTSITQGPDTKKIKLDPHVKATPSTTTTTTGPEQVHVLHILKKHKDSRRPSSWRVPTITISKDKAREELQELLSILHESVTPSNTNIDELRATFEELAKTESDCSSAKRGGDLGWFGKKKMQPAFEEASFSLPVGALSDIVDTSSGLHILLRLG